MSASTSLRHPLSRWFLACLLALILASPLVPTTARAAPNGWRDTGLDLPDVEFGRPEASLCVDPTRPHLLVVPETTGTYTYDWSVGPASRRQLNAVTLHFCNRANGLLYGELGGQPVRFSVDAPQPQPLAHLPTHLSEDSSLWAYALADGQLWASADGGLTWAERGGWSGRLSSLTAAAADARVLHAVTEVARTEPGMLHYDIWRSTDAGATWTRQGGGGMGGFGEYGGPYVTINRVGGHSAPVGLVTLTLDPGYPGSSNSRTVQISSNGGATWLPLATEKGDSYLISLFYAGDGLVKRHFTSFTISHDLGATFAPLPEPFSFNSYAGHLTPVKYAAQGPANLFASGEGQLFHSPDSGQSWQPLGDAPDGYLIAPYSPTVVLGFFGARLHVIDLPDADRSQTRGTVATGAPGGGYAAPTAHNVPAVFKAYWDAHGGLAQFGYPQTEPFREVSPTDGRVYLVQYFERNRFEYHPENAGTPYDVLLGLLGNDATAARRAAGEGPFIPVADPNLAGQRYFPQTGHTLRNSFLHYWEANGGLAVYGYPLSEEFYEVSPTDGQIYVVQYFERNRFEWHAENVGTEYEVLLGLLGNDLLAGKGWR